MTTRSAKFYSTILYFGMMIQGVAHAADIDGAWANDSAVCHKLYSKTGDSIAFAKDLFFHGSGFIIEKNRIRGKVANCNITFRREQKTRVDIIATCSTDIAVETLQFALRIEGPDKVIREFPGIPEMAIQYERCSF